MNQLRVCEAVCTIKTPLKGYQIIEERKYIMNKPIFKKEEDLPQSSNPQSLTPVTILMQEY